MSEPTLIELLEELAAWVTVDAPPEPKSAALYAVRLRAAASRLRHALEAFGTQSDYWATSMLSVLERINGGPIKP